jgi:UDP-galactopyranose mutase
MSGAPIITFSHLRWGFVYQRPQHLLSGLARRHPIFFIEEPVPNESAEPEWQFVDSAPNVTVCRPLTPCGEQGFHDHQLPHLRVLIRRLVEEKSIHRPILWFYTPMAVPLKAEVRSSLTIYDCMDELSGFLGAPPELVQREKELLASADLVFTGGRSLYRAKKERHPRVYCFPSGVDAAHFASAPTQLEAADQASLPHPRLGYYGVIDERLDLALLDTLASSHPEWQIIMVGPVVKIDPSSLPRRPNIWYTGQRRYEELPSYLAGWDLCLMPFARNPSTQYISPTKTLEYMAAGKMIVSTPITDVAEPYGDLVYLGGSAEEFIGACERAIAASENERKKRLGGMSAVLKTSSWESAVDGMHALISGALRGKTKTVKRKRSQAGTIVAGAGPTGLSAAYHVGEDCILLERNSKVGGWCRSIEKEGFTFDYAGHIMFSGDPYVHELYRMLLGNNVHWQDREAWIYSKNVYTRYPFQGSLYGLPPDVIKECIVGAIEARFGPLKTPNGHQSNGRANGASHNGSTCDSHIKDCCADGILESSAPLSESLHSGGHQTKPRNFEEFIYQVWGAGIARHFAIPYNRKLWSVPLSEMETSWLGGRVPLPDLEEMIEGALSPSPKPMGPNARFGYPLRGGFQALMEGWLPLLKGELRLNTEIVDVSPSRHRVTLSDGSELAYERLISTMPLPVLIRQIGERAPAAVRAAAGRLRNVSVRCVHLGVGRERLTDKHWIYYPEDTVFHRIFVQGNASPYCNPPGGFGLTCEITYSPYKPLPCEGDDLIKTCIEDCHRVGIFTPDDPVWVTAQCDLPYAYVVYDHARAASVGTIREWLESVNIIPAGRYSEWEYYNSDHAFRAGRKAAEAARAEAEWPQTSAGEAVQTVTRI